MCHLLRLACCPGWLALALCTWTTRVSADEPNARAWFERGLEHSRAERWEEAHFAFLRSLDLEPRVSTRFNLAVSALKLERGRECLEQLEAFVSVADPREHADYLADSAVLHGRALTLVGTLELRVTPAAASVTLDAESEPLPRSTWPALRLDPGAHTLSIDAPGYRHYTHAIRVERGQRATAAISLTPLASAPAKPIVIGHKRRARQQHSDASWTTPLLWGGGALAAVGVAVIAFLIARSGDEARLNTSSGIWFN